MPRRKPLCAWCGGSLKQGETDSGVLTLGYEQINGNPEVGWHMKTNKDSMSCFSKDKQGQFLLSEWKEGNRKLDVNEIIEALEIIENRGKGRLVANKGWQD